MLNQGAKSSELSHMCGGTGVISNGALKKDGFLARNPRLASDISYDARAFALAGWLNRPACPINRKYKTNE